MRAIGVAIFAVVTAGFGVCACAQSTPRAGSVEDAIERLDARLLGIRHVNPADLLGDRESREYRSSQSLIRQKQCAAGNPNPLVRVSAPVRVTVRARLRNEDVRIDDGAIEIALRVAAVADLPYEYLRQASAVADAATAEMAPAMRAQASRDFRILKARVSQIVASYDVGACGRGLAAAPLMLMPPSF